jgi:hypothetical protein
MAEPPEMWTFVLTNLFMFGVGLALTALSYFAYRSAGRVRSFRTSTMGFGLITLGGVSEPIYQLVLKGDYHLSGREMLAIQTVEGLLTAIGLGLLFYSIYQHNRGGRALSVGVGGRESAGNDTLSDRP